MNARALLLLLFLPAAALPQGYAGLGEEAGDYAPVTAPADIEFPRDHGAHPEFRLEWWYVTANLEGPDGTPYGVQWTLFRQAVRPGPDPGGWRTSQLWMAHAAATSATTHRHAEAFARGGIGQAGVTLGPFEAWIDDWRMAGDDALSRLTLTAHGEGFAYDLSLATDLPPVRHGEDGFSVKSDAGLQASYYYSQPFYTVSGTLTLDGRVIPVEGTAWLDREWSSQPLAEGQDGWDWFALALDGGARVMVYRMRETGGAYLAGTWIDPDGTPHPLEPDQIAATPTATAEVAGRSVPVAWRLEIPDFGLAVDTEALNAQSWMGAAFAYWEGPVKVSGSHAGKGYVEMTGY
jgi:predicted secreted hydrolase